MRPPISWLSILALIVASASCSGESKPGQGDAANTPKIEAAEAAPATDSMASNSATGQSEQSAQPEQNPVNQRPTDVTLIVGGNPQSAGTYSASQVSQVCGELRPEESINGERAFVVEFPGDVTPDISSVSFGSSKLVTGVTTTDQFRLNVNANAKQGGAPIRIAIDTVLPVERKVGQGIARLNVEAGTITLNVLGTGETGESVDLTLVCRPRQD